MRRVKSLVGFFFTLLFVQIVVLGQSLDCPTIVKNALAAVDNSCAETGRNEACYGNIILTAEAQPGIDTLSFEKAGDRVNLTDIQSLALSPMDTANQVWGIALLKVQANLPDTLPGQNVTFLLFGNVNITNAENETNGTHSTAVLAGVLTLRTTANLRSGSSTNDSIISTLNPNEKLTVDGRNAAGDWLHIQTRDGESGWVLAQLLNVNGDVNTLPVIGTETQNTAYGPMQGFYFKTAGADAPCAEAPDSGILIQTPKGAAHIDLLVNEVQINLGSTVYLQAQPNAEMTIYVIEGQATVTAQGVTVIAPAGTLVSVPMDNDLHANGVPGAAQAYDPEKVKALPISLLPDAITIAEPLATAAAGASSANAAGDGLPVSGDWCPTKTGCTNGFLPTTIQFTYEDDGAVLILAYGGGEERYTRTEPGVYRWSQGGTTAVLHVISASHFTQDFTFAGGNTSSADWTLSEASTPPP